MDHSTLHSILPACCGTDEAVTGSDCGSVTVLFMLCRIIRLSSFLARAAGTVTVVCAHPARSSCQCLVGPLSLPPPPRHPATPTLCARMHASTTPHCLVPVWCSSRSVLRRCLRTATRRSHLSHTVLPGQSRCVPFRTVRLTQRLSGGSAGMHAPPGLPVLSPSFSQTLGPGCQCRRQCTRSCTCMSTPACCVRLQRGGPDGYCQRGETYKNNRRTTVEQAESGRPIARGGHLFDL